MAQTPTPETFTTAPAPAESDLNLNAEPTDWFRIVMTYGGLVLAIVSFMLLSLFYGRGDNLLGWLDYLEKDVELQAQLERDFLAMSPKVRMWVRGIIEALLPLRTLIPGRERPKQILELLDRLTDGELNKNGSTPKTPPGAF